MSTMTAVNELTLRQFVEQLGARTPTPGGGAVAGVAAAMAASLTRMVVNYSIGRRALAEHEQFHRASLEELQQLESRALDLADEDARAYAKFNALWKLDQADPHRTREWDAAVLEAIEVPRCVMQVCLDIVNLQIELVRTVNMSLKSDLAIAGILAHAAAQAAMWNVRVNLAHVDDDKRRLKLHTDCHGLLDRVETSRKEVELQCDPDAPHEA